MGVFATRSPFRPNAIGLSCVKLEHIEPNSSKGPLLYVSGADLMDGTPILDIKPYLPGVDSHPDAIGGFADSFRGYAVEVQCPEELLSHVPEDRREALLGILAQDPRPSYQNDPERLYGLSLMFASVYVTVFYWSARLYRRFYKNGHVNYIVFL